jgi:hypothetical protein
LISRVGGIAVIRMSGPLFYASESAGLYELKARS